MRVNGNPIFQTSRNLYNTYSAVNKSLLKISSSNRITTAGDDAAGLAVGSKLRTRVQGLQQSIHNLQDGVSLLQTAEGGLENISDMLQRIRTLAIESANGNLTDDDRALLNEEAAQLVDEINRAAKTTTFNNLKLLTGYIDWTEWQTDSALRNVDDIGLVGPATYGIYNVSLDQEALAQKQTSDVKTGDFIENEDLISNSDTIASPAASGKYVYSGGNWTADFAASNIEILQSVTADGLELDEGIDYTYTDGQNGADETNGVIKISVNANTSQTINNESAGDGGANKLTVQNVITNWAFGDTLTVDDALVAQATTGEADQNYANGYLTYSLDTETYNNRTGAGEFTVGNISGSSQTIDIASQNSDMQTADAALNSLNITALSDTSVQMSGFTSANNGFSGSQILDTIASGNTSSVNAAREVTVNQTTGTFTANSLTVGKVTVSNAVISNENISIGADIGTAIADGAEVYQFTINGSNINPVLINSFVGDSNGVLSGNLQADANAVKSGGIGDYYYNSASGTFTVKVAGGDSGTLAATKITYTADWQWSEADTIENNDNTFSLAAQSSGGGNGTVEFSGGETVTYDDSITYHDDEYERISVDNTGALAGTEYIHTGNNHGHTSGVDFRNLSGVTTSRVFEWIGDSIGFETDFSIDYAYGINYLSGGFTISKNLNNGTFDVTKTSGNTTSQFIDLDESATISYNYKDMYVDSFQITAPSNATGNYQKVSVLGTGGADITASAVVDAGTGAVNISAAGSEQYANDIEIEYTYRGNWTVSNIDRNNGVLTFNDPAGVRAPQINQLVGNSSVEITYNTFKDNLTAEWNSLNSEAVLSGAQLAGGDGTADFITPYPASDSGSADPGTSTSLFLRDTNGGDPNAWLIFGTSAQVNAGTADYTIEGQSIRFKSTINPADVKAYYVSNSDTNQISLNLTDILGNTSGNSNASDYVSGNQGIFKGFSEQDKISFTIDGRLIEIDVNPSDTVEDLINRINLTSDEIFLNSGTKPDDADMGSGNNNNAGIWAELSGNQIVISSRKESDNYGYKGTRFKITVNDAQIGPGTFLNFVVQAGDESRDPSITVSDPDGNAYSSTSEDGSYFFNNATNDVDGIPGVRIKLKEDAASGS
ncbi:MAG TPA: hypothetical protein PKY81_17305, partial [bacterium]|nr:hypothetical protein [bacterium]